MNECIFCYEAPAFVITLDYGRNFDICNDPMCFGRMHELIKEDKALIKGQPVKIHTIERYES